MWRTPARSVSTLLMALLVVLGGMVAAAPSARACSPEFLFEFSIEHLLDPGLGGPDSDVARAYREHPSGGDVAPVVQGAYVVETIYAIEPEGSWTRGSVSVLAEVWGVSPEHTGPWTVETQELTDDERGDCGWSYDGPEQGTRTFHVLTDQGTFELVRDSWASDVLTAMFGEPQLAPRDTGEEDRLIAMLRSTRKTSTFGFLTAGLVAIAAAGTIVWFTRRGRPVDETGTADGLADG